MVAETVVTLEKITALCKRRGFIFQTADIYNGLNGVYDSGPLGTLMKENIRQAWKQSLRALPYDILFVDGAILGNEAMWRASGHIENFHDPLVECKACNARFRTDDVDLNKACTRCGKKDWSESREFHMMFKTQLGASVEQASAAYLRPETAQSIFVNFKNIISSSRVKIPFGVAQIGKAFRNEITPKQFLFRMREFEQMEMEFFCKHEDAQNLFEFWRTERLNFFSHIGITPEKLRLRAHEQTELSHYSSATSDVEYEFPFGWKELEGIAHRGNYDLSQHSKFSGKELAVFDDATKSSYVPDVVECSVGVDRLFLTLLFDAYSEEQLEKETRTVLRLHPRIAPVKAALLPLVDSLGEPFRQLARELRMQGIEVQFDSSGSIGKRYRRQDEIGTPFCFTYDYQSAEDQSVTVRHRDSMQQERIAFDQIQNYIKQALLA
ncbi:MAG: Glycine-tRNA ligase [candidate division TM6 bacterium GW2011_GWF2_43_17]|nr:MAG: Glycine-tRNA ligase [candidate division TM6 bacterium GW2011_GWF2_43_17]HAU30528.1 glycine--tRNA ligase [Candidatus Dependentiae bacterium]